MTIYKTVTTEDGGCESIAMSVQEEADFLAVQAAMQKEDAQMAVPREVAGWRGRAVMVLHGLDTPIKDAIAAIPDATQRTIASIGYTSADIFVREGVLLNTILKGLGKTDADIDGYFIEAAALPS